ncbi:MAG TPA: helix-turn-helix transcriptional regulator [Chryseolinea sp.]
MTKLGEYLAKKSVNRSEIARKTGLSNPRLSELATSQSAKLRASELYLIALAIETDPCDLLKYVCGDLKLLKE